MANLDNITQFSGITITSDQEKGTDNLNATFALPCLTDKQKDKVANVTPYEVDGKQIWVKPGTMIYNIDKACVQIFIKGQWQNLYAVVTTATGVGLTSGIPFIFPTGKKDDVEKEGNQVNGFTYFDSTEKIEIDKTIRTFDEGKWGTISVIPD